MTLYTTDEARMAFIRSALTILDTVDVSPARLNRLLAGRGSRRSLAPNQRSTVYGHWALLADLEQAGYRWAIDEEIEGLTSCLDVAGIDGARSAIGDQLPTWDHDEANALADLAA